MKNPLISFVTPCYNDGKDIGRMIESVMTQDYENVEQIVVNDGSTDETKKVLNKLAKKYKGRLKVVHLKKNAGACNARNVGAKLAKGKYLSFLPADAMLYPGMARIWVTGLEERPDYDFLYGGYRFTDEQYKPQMDYMGDEFDPYFLEVQNYIDGSYPLKKELFDKIAKKNTEHYSKPMGAWDTNIKSLQDWDFWINATKWCGAKGFYMPDVFFETVRPHPGGLSFDSHNNWIDRTTQIKNKYGIPIRKICVTSQGARFHGKNIAKMIGADFLDVPNFKPHKYEMIYLVGFFGNVVQMFTNFDGLRVVHWIGSDVYALLEQKKQAKIKLSNGQEVRGEELVAKQVGWIKTNIDVNFTEFEDTQKELESLGIKSQILPLPARELYDAKPLPKKFTVAVYDPYQNKGFYYPDLVKGVAAKMKDVEFNFYGDSTTIGNKGNIHHCGHITDMQKFIDKNSALLRLTIHDGLPLSVIEFASAKRNIITNVKGVKWQEYVKKLDEKSLIEAIRTTKKKSFNEKGCEYYRKISDTGVFSKKINSLIDYDAEKYWEDRADIWNAVEGSQKDSQEEYIIKNEIEKSGAKTVLDLGCGNGRWADILSENRDYIGIDISKKLIVYAKKAHPDLKFEVGDVRTLDMTKKYDLIFCYTTLLHLTPDEFKPAMERLSQIAKKLIIIEPTVVLEKTGINGNTLLSRGLHPLAIEEQQNGKIICGITSSFVHDYVKVLNISKQITLGPRTLIVVDL